MDSMGAKGLRVEILCEIRSLYQFLRYHHHPDTIRIQFTVYILEYLLTRSIFFVHLYAFVTGQSAPTIMMSRFSTHPSSPTVKYSEHKNH